MRNGHGWGSLEVRHLRAFLAVVDEGSFGDAADKLDYTQSGVSQQVLALERIIGAALLRRHPGGRRPVELTDTGRLVLPHARSLLARVNATRADVDALALGDGAPVRVASIQSIATRVLPPALSRFRAIRPEVRVEVRQTFAIEELLAAVENGDAEVGFAALPIAQGPFETFPLLADPYVLVRQAGGKERRLSDLDGRPALGIRGCQHDRLVEQRLLAEGIVPASLQRFDDNAMIQALAAAGEGIAVVPRLAIDLDDSRITAEVLPELPARQLIGIVHRERNLGASVHEFLDVVTRSASADSETAAVPRPVERHDRQRHDASSDHRIRPADSRL